MKYFSSGFASQWLAGRAAAGVLGAEGSRPLGGGPGARCLARGKLVSSRSPQALRESLRPARFLSVSGAAMGECRPTKEMRSQVARGPSSPPPPAALRFQTGGVGFALRLGSGLGLGSDAKHESVGEAGRESGKPRRVTCKVLHTPLVPSALHLTRDPVSVSLLRPWASPAYLLLWEPKPKS